MLKNNLDRILVSWKKSLRADCHGGACNSNNPPGAVAKPDRRPPLVAARRMEDSADTGQRTQLDENLKSVAARISPLTPILPICLVTLNTPSIAQESSAQAFTPTGKKRSFEEAAAETPCDENEQEPESVDTNVEGEAASIVEAVTVLQRLQREAHENEGPATVEKNELDQILRGFAKALEATRPSLEDRGVRIESQQLTLTAGLITNASFCVCHKVEKQMQSLFVSHAHVFDENMQSFIIQNFIPEVGLETNVGLNAHVRPLLLVLCSYPLMLFISYRQSDCTKKIRTALRRTSLVRRCIRAMTPATRTTTAENDDQLTEVSTSDSSTRWNAALARRVLAAAVKRPSLLDVSSAGADPKVVQAGQQEMEKIDAWTFDIFAVSQVFALHFMPPRF